MSKQETALSAQKNGDNGEPSRADAAAPGGGGAPGLGGTDFRTIVPRGRRADGGRLPAGRHGMTREEVLSSQRQRLLDAMAALATESTYPAVTVGQVVKRAKVSRATFYQIFRDKEDCFVATMEEGLRLLSGAVLPVAYGEYDGWTRKVTAVVTALLNFIADESDYSITAMVEAMAGGERAYERYSVGTQLIMSLLDEGRRASARGATLPTSTARTVLGGGEWLIASEMMAGRVERVPQLIPDYVYIALCPYLGQAEALRVMHELRELHAGT